MSEVNKVVYAGAVLLDLTGDTITEDVIIDGYTGHDKSGNVITGKLKIITVDEVLDANSTNPVQNKVIVSALDGKLSTNGNAVSATKATQDGNGNVIASTYATKSEIENKADKSTTLSGYGITDAVSSRDVGNSANKIPKYNSSGHLVLPDGSEFWIA